MSDPQNPTNGMEGAPQAQVQILGQFVKDLSFENPGAMTPISARPQIDINVDLQAKRLEPPRYEVDLKLRVQAKSENTPLFLLELVYAGILGIQNVPDEFLQQVLLIDVPHMLFPFVRRIIADVVRDGGLPPIMLEPIDFAGMFQARMAELQKQQQPASVV